MKCTRCGSEINRLNHHHIPEKGTKGKKYCIKCVKEAGIMTLV